MKFVAADSKMRTRLASHSAVCASSPQGFEDCFAAVFADKNFSDKLVVRTIHCFMSRRSAARPTEELRLETTIHEA